VIGWALALLGLAVAPPPAPEVWGCNTYLHMVEYQVARIELRHDGTFDLHHTNTSPFGGLRTSMSGTWARDGDTLVLQPKSGDKTFWRGDGHRFFHGEDTQYCAWHEPLDGGDRRLRIVHDGGPSGAAHVVVGELQTTLYSDPTKACTKVEPRPSPKPGYSCVTPTR